ncbi:MAG: choice-of-anchor D domain-containing protein [Nostocaceae cyanobacterium]|nr:choice-of-anchor D domain-containing protein [Nostocaceae cyanobacterium]
MAIITVPSLADNGSGSIREAIANALPDDTVAFDSNLANQTIEYGTSSAIDGGGAVPEIQVLDATTDIADGTITALNLGDTTVGTPLSKAFIIKNTGSGELNLSNLQLPNGFSVSGGLPATIAAGTETQLFIQLDAAASGTPSGELSFATNDSDENPFNFAIAGTVTQVNQMNNPPVNTVPVSQSILENTWLIFSPENGNAITISDPDVGTNPVQVTLNSSNGTLTLSTLQGLTFTNGTNGTASMTVTGTVTDINNALNGLLFNPLDNYAGEASVTVTTDDLGNTGNSTGLTDTDTINITINDGLNLIYGTDQSETLNGTPGDDLIYGFAGQDTIYGGAGNDQLFGFTGNDAIAGQQGNDTVSGGDGQDKLAGGDGADVLYGDAGNDLLYGEAGDDLLFGGLGTDLLVGGAGCDTFFLATGQGTDTFRDFNLSEDKIGLTSGLTFENLSIQQVGSSTFILENSHNELLAKLPGVDATVLIAQAPNIFV